MKREKLETYIGKAVEITLFDNDVIKGVLYKTGTERYKDEHNLFFPKNYYVLEIECGKHIVHSCLFRCSHVKKLKELGGTVTVKKTVYDIIMGRKRIACCRNCMHLKQEPTENKAEGTDHINFCMKSGKLVLEMHIESNREKEKCFEVSEEGAK